MHHSPLARASLAIVATTSFALLSVNTLHAQAKAAPKTSKAAEKPVWPDEGPRTWAPRPTVSAITANDLRTRLYQFADDSMSGRRIGELGNYKGTEYIAREFKRLGLKPAGDSGGYFQNLPFGPLGFDSTSSKLTVAGAAIASKSGWIPMTPSAQNGLGTKVELSNTPTVYAGRWADASITLDADAYKGKVAVFSAPPITGGGGAGRGAAPLISCSAVPNKFGAANAAAVEAAQRADSAAGRGGRGAGGGRGGAGGGLVRDLRAQNVGAIAVLVSGLENSSAATINGVFASRGAMQPAPAAAGSIGGAIVSNATIEKLFGKPIDQLKAGDVGQSVSGGWNYAWTMSKTPARNVIAIMPGSDPARASEYVLVGAHNDHVGTNAVAQDHDSLRAVNMITRPQGSNDPACTPTPDQQRQIDSLIKRARSIRAPRRDSIMNGADDDGSGTVVLLEIAEKFASEKPARSIIFVSHEGEEAGLLGSRWFTDHPTIPLDKVAAAHNMDMLGKGRTDEVKFGGPNSVQTLGSRRLSREFGDIIDSVNATRSEPMAIDKSWDVVANPMNRFCRSDQVNYVHKDVPVTYFSTGYAMDYHQLTDEPQYIEYDHAARLARFIHDVMWAVSERKTRPAIAGPDPNYPQCR